MSKVRYKRRRTNREGLQAYLSSLQNTDTLETSSQISGNGGTRDEQGGDRGLQPITPESTADRKLKEKLKNSIFNNKILGQYLNDINFDISFADQDRQNLNKIYGGGGSIEAWFPDDEGPNAKFNNPSLGKYNVEIYDSNLKNNPEELGNTIFRDVLHFLPHLDKNYKKLRDKFSANFSEEELIFLKSKYEKLGKPGKSFTEWFDRTIVDGYIRGAFNEPSEFGELYNDENNKTYTPKQREILQKMKDYLAFDNNSDENKSNDTPDKIPQIDRSRIVDVTNEGIEQTKKNFPQLFGKQYNVSSFPEDSIEGLLKNQTTVSESTQPGTVKQGDVETGRKMNLQDLMPEKPISLHEINSMKLFKAVDDYQKQSAFPEQMRQAVKETFGFDFTIEDMRKGSEIYRNIEESNKGLFQKAAENVDNIFKTSVQRLNDAVNKTDNDWYERLADAGLGLVSTGINTVMTPMHFFTPASKKIGDDIGDALGNKDVGNTIGEFLPFLTLPNPLAFFVASKGSEAATNEVMKLFDDAKISEENKLRIAEAIGLGTFIATHKLVVKGGNFAREQVRDYFVRSVMPEATASYDQLTPIEKKVFDSYLNMKGRTKAEQETIIKKVDKVIQNAKGREIPTSSSTTRSTDRPVVRPELPAGISSILTGTKKENNLTVLIGGKEYPVRDIKDASQKFEKARDESGLGSADYYNKMGKVLLFDAEGNKVGHISYNGKVWDNKENVIYNPSGEKKNETIKSLQENVEKTAPIEKKIETKKGIQPGGKVEKPKAKVEKQPYEMSRDEATAHWIEYYNKSLTKYKKKNTNESKTNLKVAENNLQASRELHRKSVEQAIKEGKTIPEEVLKEYPDLQSKAKVKKTGVKTYYRGISSFNKNKTDKFYSVDEEVAKNYANADGKNSGKIETITEEELPQNLYEIGDKEEFAEKFEKELEPYDISVWEDEFDQRVKEILQPKGYEGIRYVSGTSFEQNGIEEIHLFGKEKDTKNTSNIRNKEKKIESQKSEETLRQAQGDILTTLDYVNDKEVTPGQRTTKRGEAMRKAKQLREQGVNALIKKDGNKWNLFIDGKKQNRTTLGLADKPELQKAEDVVIDNENAKKPFEELPEDVRKKQIKAVDFVDAEDLPAGIGPKKLEKGKKDIEDDDGKEQSPEAQIVRDAAEDILKSGKENIQPVKGGRGTRTDLSAEEVNKFVDEQLKEEKPEIIDEETYLTRNGAPFMGGAEPALHKNIQEGRGKQQMLKKVSEDMTKNNKRREELRKEYREKVARGEIRPPTRIEKLIATANGHPDLESVQAARRILEKQGIDWKNAEVEIPKELQAARDKLEDLQNDVFATDQEKKVAKKELGDLEAKYSQESLKIETEKKKIRRLGEKSPSASPNALPTRKSKSELDKFIQSASLKDLRDYYKHLQAVRTSENKVDVADEMKKVRQRITYLENNQGKGKDIFTAAEEEKQGSLLSAKKPVVEQTGTPEFKRWFSNSKIIDDDGKPLVVYHGTGSDFDIFDKQGRFDQGYHFGSIEQANMRYGIADWRSTVYKPAQKNIMPVYLRMEKPRRSKDVGAGNWRTKVASAKAAGYDGIIYLNRYEGITNTSNLDLPNLDRISDEKFKKLFPEAKDSYIVFNSNQIKSATGNRGTFSINEPSIILGAKSLSADDYGKELSKDLLSIREYQLDNPHFDDAELVYSDKELYYIRTKEDWLNKYHYDPVANNFELVKKGDPEYEEGKEKYRARVYGHYQDYSGKSRIRLYRRAGMGTAVEEFTHHIQTKIKRENGKLQKQIEGWEGAVRAAAAEADVDIPLGPELFAHSYLTYLGWEKPAAEFLTLPAEIIEEVNKIASSSKSGKDNLPKLMKPGKRTQALISKGTEERGFTFEAGKLELLNAQRPNAPPFYSKMQKVLDKKLPEKFNPDMLENIIRSGEIKEAEIKWSGLDDFVKQKKAVGEKIDKQQVMDFLKANELKIEEVEKGNAEDWQLIKNDLEIYGKAYTNNEKITVDKDGNYKYRNDVYESLEELHNAISGDIGITKYHQYTLPGGENYSELLFTLPTKKKESFEEWNRKRTGGKSQTETQLKFAKAMFEGQTKRGETAIGFKSGHWDEPNVFAHARVNDRVTADGKQILFIEELQSDWGQKIRQEGIAPKLAELELPEGWAVKKNVRGLNYASEEVDKWQVYNTQGETIGVSAFTKDDAIKNAKKTGYFQNKNVPDMPFKNNWHEFVLKNLIRKAAESGYDGIGWITGEQTAERYDLSKQVERIRVQKFNNDNYQIWGLGKDQVIKVAKDNIEPNKLADYIGKDLADKVLRGENLIKGKSKGELDYQEFYGKDLKIDAAWAKTLYDKVIPNFLNKYGKKWGAKVGEIEIGSEKQFNLYNTNVIRDAKQYKIIDRNDKVLATMTLDTGDSLAEISQENLHRELVGLANSPYGNKIKENIKAHSLPITEQMKESVLFEGQTLFSAKPPEKVTNENTENKEPEQEEIFSLNDTPADQNGRIAEENDRAPIELPAETIVRKMQRKIQDKYNRAAQVVNLVKKEGREVTEGEDFRTDMELYIGKATDKTVKMMEKVDEELLKPLADENFSVEDFGNYLYARHAPERNLKIEDEYGKENGSGMTDEQAQEIIDRYEGTVIEQLAERFDEIVIKPMKRELEAAGLVKEGDLDIYEHYIPLKGLFAPEGFFKETHTGTGKGFSVRSRGVMKAKGRKSKAKNPFVQAITDFEQAIVRAEKNKVGQTFLKFMRENSDLKVVRPEGMSVPLWKEKAVRVIPKFDEEGEVINYEVLDKGLMDDEFNVWEDGKRKIVTINDPTLARVMKNMGQNISMGILQSAANIFRNMATTWNPEFIIMNLVRDLQTGAITGSEKKIALKIAAGIPKAMNGVFKSLKKDLNNDYAKLYEELKAEGGKVGWLSFDTMEIKTKRFEKKIRTYQKQGNIKKVLESTREFMDGWNEIFESATRLSAYKALIDQGLSKKQAADYVKNLTVNFNKKGEWGTVMNTLYLFSNAGLQGTARILKAIKSPKVRNFLYGYVAFSAMLAIINRMIDDDEYDKIPDYVKDTNMIFMLGDGKFLKLRLPYGYNWFAVLGNGIGEVINGKEIGSQLGRTGNAFVDAVNPMGTWGSFAQFLSFTLADPIIQITTNETFFGAPLKPEQPPYQPDLPEHQLYFDNVRGTTKKATEYVYDLTDGAVDVSPEDIDALIDGYFSGVGKTIENSLATGEALISGEDLDPLNIPLWRQVYGRTLPNYEKQLIYEMWRNSRVKDYSPAEKERFLDALDQALKTEQIDEGQKVKLKRDFYKYQGENREEVIGLENTIRELKRKLNLTESESQKKTLRDKIEQKKKELKQMNSGGKTKLKTSLKSSLKTSLKKK